VLLLLWCRFNIVCKAKGLFTYLLSIDSNFIYACYMLAAIFEIAFRQTCIDVAKTAKNFVTLVLYHVILERAMSEIPALSL
jgi:hypothetical protein